MRSRLTEQKGFDLILEGLQQWSHSWPVQFIIIAWGEKRYATPFKKLATAHPQRIAFSDSWRAAPEPLHYAGADMLLMPSLFEPCGLPHMMALRYGTNDHTVAKWRATFDLVDHFETLPSTKPCSTNTMRPSCYIKKNVTL